MDEHAFRKLVREALDTLPQKFKEILNNVDIVVSDEPTPLQKQKMHLRPSVLLYGLYEGIPQTERGNYTGVLPDKITIFRLAIEKSATSEDDIKEQVRRTVLHEIGHHFGMSDRELRDLNY